ncbi:MAG TPA: hypothetical protein VG095_03000, partial [Chthoniobacterales bacterium]|nr:hypothetical protein [Chthoniobacterales bacterium]
MLLVLATIATPHSIAESGQQTAQLFRLHAELATRLPSLLFLPAGYDHHPVRQWQLIVYLHGGSLRGDDVERLRTMG